MESIDRGENEKDSKPMTVVTVTWSLYSIGRTFNFFIALHYSMWIWEGGGESWEIQRRMQRHPCLPHFWMTTVGSMGLHQWSDDTNIKFINQDLSFLNLRAVARWVKRHVAHATDGRPAGGSAVMWVKVRERGEWTRCPKVLPWRELINNQEGNRPVSSATQSHNTV